MTNHLGDDHVNLLTRAVSVIIIPILLTAVAILYFLPGQTGQLFAWKIDSAMTAMTLGAVYAGGAYFFGRALFTSRWHRFGNGFLAIWAFVILMALATLLHLDKFNHGHVAFYAWALIYFVTPFLIPLVWWLNRPADPGRLDAGDFELPGPMRLYFLAYGLGALALSALLLALPDVMIQQWPWPLTPLTARVTAAMFALPGVLGLVAYVDRRWSAVQVVIEAQIVPTVLILFAIARAWDEFDLSRPLSWGFLALMTGGLLIAAWLWVYSRRELAAAGA